MSLLHLISGQTEAIASQDVLCDAQVCIGVLQEDVGGAPETQLRHSDQLSGAGVWIQEVYTLCSCHKSHIKFVCELTCYGQL